MSARFLTTAAFVLLLAHAATAAEFHVAPTGNDANPGTQARPFATLQAGVNSLQPGDTLLVRGGVYRETVTFPRSGTAEKSITVRAYRNEKVVISGCEPVTGWTVHDAAKNIWKAPMPWTLGTGRNQVFRDGDVMIEARHPNKPAPGLGMFVSDLSPLWPTFGEFSIPDPAKLVTGYYCSGGTLNGLRTRIAYNVLHDNYDLFATRINALGMVYLDAEILVYGRLLTPDEQDRVRAFLLAKWNLD